MFGGDYNGVGPTECAAPRGGPSTQSFVVSSILATAAGLGPVRRRQEEGAVGVKVQGQGYRAFCV